jgi:large subunit ribosomal protein L21
MAYAIIQTGGKQYRVSEGDKLDVENLGLDAGSTATFDQVLCLSAGAGLQVGTPVLAGASVEAKVIGPVRAKKVIAFKYKRRKGFHKTIGHRRQMTRLEIQSINA